MPVYEGEVLLTDGMFSTENRRFCNPRTEKGFPTPREHEMPSFIPAHYHESC